MKHVSFIADSFLCLLSACGLTDSPRAVKNLSGIDEESLNPQSIDATGRLIWQFQRAGKIQVWAEPSPDAVSEQALKLSAKIGS